MQTFGSNVNIDTDVTFNCSFSADETRKCNLSTEHIFLVSDDKPFGKTFPVTITVAYFECTNFITHSLIGTSYISYMTCRILSKCYNINFSKCSHSYHH